MNVSGAKRELILTLNSGSSSLKFGVYTRGSSDEEPLLTGSAEGVGRDSGSLQIKSSAGQTLLRRDCIHESQMDALNTLATAIQEHVHDSPVAVGHRVVHGGPKLRVHQLITSSVLDELRAATHFAPMHIPQALKLISGAQAIFPDAVHFACFDNAFHQTLPEVASHFALPENYFERGIRRYGFHGLSYESLVHHFSSKLPEKVIFAHLGNGASLCAVQNRVSIDTTMGLTPTGGIPMGTRSGDLDPGVLLYLLRAEKLSVDELEDLLNHKAGLFALSSGESDFRKLEKQAQSGDRNATLALVVFAVAVRKVIGSYMALLGGLDLLVFSGGIGEHSAYIRQKSTHGLEALGLKPEMIQVVATQEELQIARHCRAMLAAG